ncbi:hypothetical protein D3C85_1010280 [compost metagenome]
MEFVAQATDTTNLPDNPLIFDYTVVNTARTNKLKFRTYAAMSNVRIRISQTSNGVTAKYIPSQQAWEEEFGGIEWVLGDNTYDFGDTPLIFNAGTELEVEIRADNVALKGNASGIPYFTATLQVGEFRDIITEAVYTAEDVRDKITSLSGTNRLSGNALKENVVSVNAMTGAVVIDKTTVGLGNVDNTSDLNKPVSTAQAAAIAASMAAHNAAVDPHTQYTTVAEAAAAAPVQAVNGETGSVSLVTADIPESVNLYYTDARVGTYLTNNGYTVKTVASVGAGSSVYQTNTAGAVTLRSIIGTGGVSVVQNANDITVSTPTLASGVYTPTLTNVNNVSASTSFEAQWLRVGNVVTVSGRVDIDPTGSGSAVHLGISLPVASNFTADSDLSGVGGATDVAGQVSGLHADTTNDRASLEFVSQSTANQEMYYHYTYEVK